MQGEAVMLFWGNEDVLWLAVAGVMIIALLLIRVGIAHFQREYLLGREIDTINLKWVLNTFWKNFMGGAHSIGEWYRKVLGGETAARNAASASAGTYQSPGTGVAPSASARRCAGSVLSSFIVVSS